MKIVQWEQRCYVRTDRHNVTKLKVAFRNTTNAPKNLSMSFLCITDYAGHMEKRVSL